MTKEEYRKASHFRDATKMVAAPGSQSGLFDYAPLFRVCFLCRPQWPTRAWRPVSVEERLAPQWLTSSRIFYILPRISDRRSLGVLRNVDLGLVPCRSDGFAVLPFY